MSAMSTSPFSTRSNAPSMRDHFSGSMTTSALPWCEMRNTSRISPSRRVLMRALSTFSSMAANTPAMEANSPG